VRIEESPYSKEHETGEIPGRGNLSDRATETYRLFQARVKWWCKRPPETAVMRLPGNPFQEQGQAEAIFRLLVWPVNLDASGGPHRQIVIQAELPLDRIRLIDQPDAFSSSIGKNCDLKSQSTEIRKRR